MTDVRYSEIFKSIQGEGLYTGVPTLWIRYWMCNLTCSGFGQEDPTNPETYDLPYKKIDAEKIKKLSDLPVLHRGCDSAYSWAKKFEHLSQQEPHDVVARKIAALSPTNSFIGPYGTEYHMCFTGGEPMIKRSQKATRAILDSFMDFTDPPRFLTFETNGTQKLDPEFIEFMNDYIDDFYAEVLWSFSPKLFNTSGEPFKRAIKADRIASYLDDLPSKATFKFVVNGTQETWDELDEVLEEIEQAVGYDVREDVWIMPEGGTYEMQKRHDAEIAQQTIDKGYKVAARLQNYLFGNVIGS